MKLGFDYACTSIEILNSIPPDESQTANQLQRHLQDQKYHEHAPQIDVVYTRIENASDLFGRLGFLAEKAADFQLNPLIHLECHGSPVGLQLSSGEHLAWQELTEYLRKINYATRNHLLVILSACWGFHGIKTAQSPLISAPFRLWGGPNSRLAAGELIRASQLFYSALMKGESINVAAEHASLVDPSFRLYSADQAFVHGWRTIIAEHPKSGAQIQKRVESLVTRAKLTGNILPPRPHRLMKKALRAYKLENLFRRSKKVFFMLGQFQEIVQETVGITFRACADSGSPIQQGSVQAQPENAIERARPGPL